MRIPGWRGESAQAQPLESGALGWRIPVVEDGLSPGGSVERVEKFGNITGDLSEHRQIRGLNYSIATTAAAEAKLKAI